MYSYAEIIWSVRKFEYNSIFTCGFKQIHLDVFQRRIKNRSPQGYKCIYDDMIWFPAFLSD